MTPDEDDVKLLRSRLRAFVPFLLAITAFCLSYAGNFYCDNIEFVPVMPLDADTQDFFQPRPLSFGLWVYKQQKIVNRLDGEILYSEGCAGYHSELELDQGWKTARAFSCISVIVAGFLLLWQFAAPFLLFDALYWRWAMGIFTFIGVCQGFTFFFVSSMACHDNPMIELMVASPDIYPDSCSWDWGTNCSLASCVFYFATVVSMIFIPAPGIRPNERQFPMMVWGDDDDKARGHRTRDDEDEKSYCLEDSDDDSVDSFAYDSGIDDDIWMNESVTGKKNTAPDELEETERSCTGYSDFDDDDGDDDMNFSVSKVGVDTSNYFSFDNGKSSGRLHM